MIVAPARIARRFLRLASSSAQEDKSGSVGLVLTRWRNKAQPPIPGMRTPITWQAVSTTRPDWRKSSADTKTSDRKPEQRRSLRAPHRDVIVHGLGAVTVENAEEFI